MSAGHGGDDTLNEQLSGAEQITAFTILPTEWSVAGGELTPTLKLKRSVITRKYAGAIEAMYAQGESTQAQWLGRTWAATSTHAALPPPRIPARAFLSTVRNRIAS
jgi:hypothetical protein